MARQRAGGGQPTPPQPPPSGPSPAPPDPAAAAQTASLAAAMRFLGEKIAIATGAISRPVAALAFRRDDHSPRPSLNPGRQAPAIGATIAPAVTGLFGGLLSTLVGKITVALAPIAVLGAAIGSPTSGFGVFLSAIKLLGGTLGSLLLPGFLVLSAMVYAVSGYIADKLLPVLKQWYTAFIDGAITGAQLFEAAVVYAAIKVREFAEWLRNFNEGMKGEVRRKAKELGGPEDDRNVFDRVWRRFMQGWQSKMDRGEHPGGPPVQLGGMFGGMAIPRPSGAVREGEFDRILREIRDRDKRGDEVRPSFRLGGMFGGAEVAGGRPRSAEDRFLEGLRRSRDELRFQTAPQARFTTGTDLYKEAQLAAVQVSPFEKTAMDFMGKVLGVLDDVVGNLPKPALVD